MPCPHATPLLLVPQVLKRQFLLNARDKAFYIARTLQARRRGRRRMGASKDAVECTYKRHAARQPPTPSCKLVIAVQTLHHPPHDTNSRHAPFQPCCSTGRDHRPHHCQPVCPHRRDRRRRPPSPGAGLPVWAGALPQLHSPWQWNCALPTTRRAGCPSNLAGRTTALPLLQTMAMMSMPQIGLVFRCGGSNRAEPWQCAWFR